MKMKALLLGSAAAIVVVGNAAAADLPAAAPADYVQICGDFSESYVIPGTDVCLDIGGMVSFEVDVSRTGGKTTVDYSTDADLHVVAQTATEYGALIAHIELEADDVVGEDGKDLELDDTYVQLGGDLFVKAGYYDGVGDVGDDILTADITGQGDTVGMGYGVDNLSFAVDVLLDSDENNADPIEGVGASASYSMDDLTIELLGGAAFGGSGLLVDSPYDDGPWDGILVKNGYTFGASVGYSLDALSFTVAGHYVDSKYKLTDSTLIAAPITLDVSGYAARANITYAVTDALEIYADGEFGHGKFKAASRAFTNAAGVLVPADKLKATTDIFNIDVGADYTITEGLVAGVNGGATRIDWNKKSKIKDSTEWFLGADVTRSF